MPRFRKSNSALRYALVTSLLAGATAVRAQEASDPQASQPTSTLTVRSTLVLAPAMVKTKSGARVFSLTADDFIITDDGIPQPVTLEEGADAQPIAIAFVVQTGGSGAGHVEDYENLQIALDTLVGAVPHRIAVVGFDSKPFLAQDFTTSNGLAADALANLQPGDKHAAIYDALAYAVDALRHQPPQYRRALILVSETVDHGSHLSLAEAVRALGDTNTAMYTLSFGSTRADIHGELANLSQTEPNQPGGCMARDPDKDADHQSNRAAQTLECASELLPPLRIATIAMKALIDALRRNAPLAVARATGGEHFTFYDAHGFANALLSMSNDIPNRYMLSFRPIAPHSGLHTIEVTAKDRPQVRVQARTSYFVDAPAGAPATK